MASATEARAEWQFAPFFGLTFNGDTSLADLEGGTERVHWNFGGSVTVIGGWPIGVEGLFTYTPQFFEGEGPNLFESSSAFGATKKTSSTASGATTSSQGIAPLGSALIKP